MRARKYVRNNRVVPWALTGQQLLFLVLLRAIGLYYAYDFNRPRQLASV